MTERTAPVTTDAPPSAPAELRVAVTSHSPSTGWGSRVIVSISLEHCWNSA